MSARLATNNDCRKSLTRSQDHFFHPDWTRDEVSVSSNKIERHSINFHAQKTVGSDVADLPELRLASSNGMILEEKDSFGQTFQERIKTVAALNKNSSGHASNDLSVDVSVRVRMI